MFAQHAPPIRTTISVLVLLVCLVRAEVWLGGHTELGEGSRPMGPALLSTPAEASFPFLACRRNWEHGEVLPMWRVQWLKERGTVHTTALLQDGNRGSKEKTQGKDTVKEFVRRSLNTQHSRKASH